MMIMIEKHPPRPNALTEHPNGFHPERGKLFLPMWNPPAQTQLSRTLRLPCRSGSPTRGVVDPPLLGAMLILNFQVIRAVVPPGRSWTTMSS